MGRRNRDDPRCGLNRLRSHPRHQFSCIHRPVRFGQQFHADPGSTVRGALAILFAFSVAASSATVNVTDSVSRALESAQDGDTILLEGPRAFQERVVIAKSVRLLGTNSPVIDA